MYADDLYTDVHVDYVMWKSHIPASLSIYLSIYLSLSLSLSLCLCLYLYLSISSRVYLHPELFFYELIYLSTYLNFIYVHVEERLRMCAGTS